MRKKTYHLLAVLTALLAGAALSGAALAAGGAPERAVVRFDRQADPEALTAALEALEGVEVLWTYDRLFSGAAIEGAPEALDAAEALHGVEGVGLARTYALPQSGGAAAGEDGGLAMMGLEEMWDQGYDGDGMVIAVLDSGMRVTHDAFADYGLAQSPALSRADVEAFSRKGGTKGAYLSARIPFAYDYFGRDTDVSTIDDHGSHVAALAAGYVPEAQGAFRGAAPAAQILSMKVFPDGTVGGADDAVILRALEDAWNLGADVVNLSLGTPNGYTQDDVLDGLYCQAFAQMRRAGVIICCAAGNIGGALDMKMEGSSLPTASYTDYGTLCSPASYIGALGVGAAEWSAGVDSNPVTAGYSNWGTTSDLRLKPELTAFGGMTLSAGSRDDSYFYQESGTSMASGSAAGAFAVLLQSLRERGVTNRQEAANLAQSLMESAARILRDGTGVPFSPRKQGAGLVDPAAAAASDLTILDPLLELGDSEKGSFTASFTLRNLSDRELTVQLAAEVVTDAYEKQGDTYYSRMTPMDITSEVTVSGLEPVTIPARGERTVTVEISAGLPRLRSVFSNGYFVEGYITAGAGEGQAVHATFLGYCGDWSAAPILEPVDFRDVQDALLPSGGKDSYWDLLAVNMGANLPRLGQSGETTDRLLGESGLNPGRHSDLYNDLSRKDVQAMYSAGHLLNIELFTLRNAARAVMLVSDQDTGAVYAVQDSPWLVKSQYNGYDQRMGGSSNYQWDGTDSGGNPLPAGTRVRVDFYAWLDCDKEMEAVYGQSGSDYGAPETYRWLLSEEYAPYREWSFPVTIDGAAPSVNVSGEAGNLTVTFQDDLHLAYAAVWDSGGRLLSEKRLTPQTAGESVSVTVDASGAEEIYVAAEDYASNAVGYVYDLETLTAAECPAAILTDVNKGAWYHEAVDYVRAKDLMEGETALTFQPQDSATRAQVVSALYAAAGSPSTAFSAGDLPFTDISAETPYLPALTWAYGQGIVDGYNENTFGGMASVTRQQLAVMLRRCAQLYGTVDPAGDLSGFADRSSVADWARDGLSWAVGEGLIAGRSSDALDPQGLTTRAELAQIVMRFVEG